MAPRLGRAPRPPAGLIGIHDISASLHGMERGGFEPPKAFAGRFTVCSLWPLGYLSTHWVLNPRAQGHGAARNPSPSCSTPHSKQLLFRTIHRTSPGKSFAACANLAGAGDRIRTYDLLITNQLLYRLSYASAFGTFPDPATPPANEAPRPQHPPLHPPHLRWDGRGKHLHLSCHRTRLA